MWAVQRAENGSAAPLHPELPGDENSGRLAEKSPSPRVRTRKSSRLTPVPSNDAPKRAVIDLTTATDDDAPSPIKRLKKDRSASPAVRSRALSRRYNIRGEGTAHNLEIDSSPIKRSRDENSDFRPPAAFLSSPVKKKKSVAFSGNLVSDLGSSPVSTKQALYEEMPTPRKSILKSNVSNHDMSPSDPNNASLWVKCANTITSSTNAPKNPMFWLPGTIIQLLPNSADLPQLIEGCMHVLADSAFDKKFEVYATLNHICKFNTVEALVKLFTIQSKPVLSSPIKPRERPSSPSVNCHNYINELSLFVQRDITSVEENIFAPMENKENDLTASPGKGNPFTTRTLSQALKLMCFIMVTPELNVFLSVADVKWYYTHSCEMITKPTISKTLILPYLSILKDCKFFNKKKRLIFESGESTILEQVLFGLLKMKKFPSSSLVAEKYITFRNLVLNFPLMMARNFDRWFGLLVVNLCDLASPLHAKVVATGISCLLEVARNYLDNESILFSARKFLESPLAAEYESFSSEHSISTSGAQLEDVGTVIEFVIANLESLIHSSQQKQAMDIWVGLTLLAGGNESGFDSWKFLTKWLQVHKLCFNQSDTSVKIIALSSWKAVIHNMCYKDLKNLKNLLDPLLPNSPMKEAESKSKTLLKVNEILRPKVKLLIYILVNMTSVENQKDIIDTLHGLFLSMIYTLINPLSIKSNIKYMHIYWDKIIQPVLTNFYFKKGLSSNYMNELGLDILNRLVKNASPINEKNFNDIRCLSSEPVTLNEINSISPKWIVKWFDRIMQNIVLVFKAPNLSTEAKLTCFNTFLNSVKVVTKKEMKTSDSTFDLIDNIPFVLKVLFKHDKPSFELMFKLVINLNDTFGACNLINHEAEEDAHSTVNVYSLILEQYLHQLNTTQVNDTLNLMYQAIGEKKNIVLILQLVQMNVELKRSDLDDIIATMLNTKKINKAYMLDLQLAGQIFQVIELNYGVAAKRLIQDVVLVKPDEFERLVAVLKVQKWTLPVFKFFIALIHDAPYFHLKQMGLNLILSKWENADTFLDLFTFLVDLKFDLEIFNLRKNFMKKAKDLSGFHLSQFTETWTSYIRHVSEGGNFVLLDQLLVCSFEGNFDIKNLINNCWEKLPLLKKAWLEVNDELYWDPELLKAIEVPEASLPDNESPPKEKELPVSELIVLSEKPSDDQVFIDLDGLVPIEQKESPIIDEVVCLNEVVEPEQDAEIVAQEEVEDKADLGLAVPDISKIRSRTLTEDARLRPSSSAESVDSVDSPKEKGKKKLRASPKLKGKKRARKLKEESDKTNSEENNTSMSQNAFDIHSFTALLTAKLSTPPKEPTKTKKRARRGAKAEVSLIKAIANGIVEGVKSEPKDDLVDTSEGETPQDSTNDTSVDESTTIVEKLSREASIAPTTALPDEGDFLDDSHGSNITLENAGSTDPWVSSSPSVDSPRVELALPVDLIDPSPEKQRIHRNEELCVLEYSSESNPPLKDVQYEGRSPKRQKLNPAEEDGPQKGSLLGSNADELQAAETANDEESTENGTGNVTLENDLKRSISNEKTNEEVLTITNHSTEEAAVETNSENENDKLQIATFSKEAVEPTSSKQLVPVPSLNTVVSTRFLGNLAECLHGISNEDIANASEQERYHLETQLMEFMVRMRRTPSAQP